MDLSIRRALLGCAASAALALPMAAAAAQQAAANAAAAGDQAGPDQTATGQSGSAIRPGETTATQPDQAPAEIVVTAQRRSESLQKVPIAVDVATGEQIQKLNLFDFRDVQQLSPGLDISNNDGRSNVATLRGITFNPDSGSAPSVNVYINDIQVDPQVAFTAIYDVAQIEVLRGPQGLFRGSTSPAGSITLTTRKPNLDATEGYFQGSVTSRNAVNVQGAASIPLVPGKLALRAAALVDFNRGNYVKNVATDRRSRGDTESYRLSLQAEPTERLNATLIYQYLSSDQSPQIAVFGPGNQPSLLDPSRSGPPLKIGDRKAVAELDPRFTNETHLVTFEANYDMDFATLSLNSGYQDSKLKQLRDVDAPNAVPNYAQAQRTDTPYKVTTVDLRLASNGHNFIDWIAGALYFHQNSAVSVAQDNTTFFGLPSTPLPASAGFPVTVGVRVPVKTSTYSAFGSVRLNFTDRLRLEAGARYSVLDFDQQSFLTVTLPTLGLNQLTDFPTIGAANASRRYKPVTGGASLSYDVTPDVSTYVSYARSYRPGSAAVGLTTPLSDALTLSKSEKANSFEAGIKTRLFDRRVTFNLSGFYQKYKNYIDHVDSITTSSARNGVVDASTAPINTNGDVTAKGVEAQLTARFGRFVDLGASASYVDAKYDNALLPCNDYNGDGAPDSTGTPRVPVGQEVAFCRRNDRIAQVPKFTLTANGEVRFASEGLQPFLRGLVNFRPGFSSIYDNYRYRDFTNVSLFVGIRGDKGRWELSAFAKNLLDQARAIRVSQGEVSRGTSSLDPVTGGSGAPFLSGYRTATISPPREFGVTGRFSF